MVYVLKSLIASPMSLLPNLILVLVHATYPGIISSSDLDTSAAGSSYSYILALQDKQCQWNIGFLLSNQSVT